MFDLNADLLKKTAENEKGFSHFDLGLTEREASVLERLQVGPGGTYDAFGVDASLKESLVSFLGALGNSQHAQMQAAIMSNLVQQTLENLCAESAWVTVRAQPRCQTYDVPRWHTDGYFFDPTATSQVKVVVALKGARTLLAHLSPEDRERLMELQRRGKTDLEHRRSFAETSDLSRVEVTPVGCGTVFVVGAENAAVHSEPPIGGDRFFLSIVPGSSVQIESLRQRWKREKTQSLIASPTGEQRPIAVVPK